MSLSYCDQKNSPAARDRVSRERVSRENLDAVFPSFFPYLPKKPIT